MRLTQLNRLNFDQEVLSKDGLVLVDFYSPQCAVCRGVTESVKEIAEGSHGITVGTVNVDWNPKFTAAHNVDQIPTLIFYKNGVELTRIMGQHSKEEILNLLANWN